MEENLEKLYVKTFFFLFTNSFILDFQREIWEDPGIVMGQQNSLVFKEACTQGQKESFASKMNRFGDLLLLKDAACYAGTGENYCI